MCFHIFNDGEEIKINVTQETIHISPFFSKHHRLPADQYILTLTALEAGFPLVFEFQMTVWIFFSGYQFGDCHNV